MPFTPFHMGPGILVKSLLQGSFSLMVFGWSQIVMDLQPLWVLLTGDGHMHGFSHTFIGCTLISIFAAISGKYLSEFGLILLRLSHRSQPVKIIWSVAFISAFIGGFSHVALDAVMHADVQPFFPFELNNPILGIISINHLHQLCLYSGVVGAVIFFVVHWRHRKI